MFDELVKAASEMFGLYGLGAVLVILVGVWLGKRSGLVVGGNYARLANLALGATIAGLSGDPTAEAAVEGAIASIGAALLYKLLVLAKDKWIAASRPASTDAA